MSKLLGQFNYNTHNVFMENKKSTYLDTLHIGRKACNQKVNDSLELFNPL